MKQNLDVLKTEIQEYLESRHLVIYHAYSRTLDALPIVMWDTDRHPEYKEFIAAAEAVGAKMLAMHTREFSAAFVDNALEEIEDADMSPDDRRTIERRLREMRAYDGFTCAIELSFDMGQRAYIFELRTEWYNEFSDLLDEIDAAFPGDDDEDEDEGPIGGYFSKN
jgi:hypothetical protein